MDVVKAIIVMVQAIKDKRRLWIIYDFIKHLK